MVQFTVILVFDSEVEPNNPTFVVHVGGRTRRSAAVKDAEAHAAASNYDVTAIVDRLVYPGHLVEVDFS